MIVRGLKTDDLGILKSLHEKHFGADFDFPELFENYLVGFAVTDANDEIILAGGVRRIGETVLITDKSKNMHSIGKALVEALQVSNYVCKQNNIDLLHAFVKDEAYARHLIKHGFNPRCQALVTQVPNG